MISTYDHFIMERMDHYDKGFEKAFSKIHVKRSTCCDYTVIFFHTTKMNTLK